MLVRGKTEGKRRGRLHENRMENINNKKFFKNQKNLTLF